MNEALAAAVEAIAPRFRSGNRIPVDKAQVPASEWHALVAALASAPAEPVALPAGWKLSREATGEIIVNGPPGGCVVRNTAPAPRTIPEELLHALAGTLIDAAPTPQATAPANPWRDAVINELVVAHIYRGEHDTNPRKAVQDAITWHCQVALDPAVSSAAEALVQRGRGEATAPAGAEPGNGRFSPCPFCGAGAETVAQHGLRRVQCRSCKASTHNYDTTQEAEALWNLRDKRAAPSQATAGVASPKGGA